MDHHHGPDNTSLSESNSQHKGQEEQEQSHHAVSGQNISTQDFTSVETLHVPQHNIGGGVSAETLNTNIDTSLPPKTNREWSMTPQVIRNAERDAAAGFKKRELGVTWKDLTVEVLAAEAAVNENMISQFNIPQLIKDFRRKPPVKPILSQSHGCVKPGEMLLVLGRPGSGCTTLLKMLSNRREGYHSVTGDVRFGNMTPKEANSYNGQIVMNTEEELFYPRLTVGQTMDFATRLKVPFHLPEDTNSAADYTAETKQFLLESMGITHTADTKVGNEFVRGVSGGERKRVSIIECLATRGSVYSWDNSTRGLDASTALEWAKALRAMTDVLGLSTIVTLYQAGNGIYNLFDKVLVLDEGKQIYYGPAATAKPFMEDLGFIYTDGANVGKFPLSDLYTIGPLTKRQVIS